MITVDATRSDVERQGFSADEAARIIGIGRTTVYDLIKQGRIRSVKIGVRRIIPKGEIDRLLGGDDNGAA